MVKIRILKSFSKYREGEVIEVKADAEGVPLDIYWRRRLKDSHIDEAVEVVKAQPKKSKSKPVTEDPSNGKDND